MDWRFKWAYVHAAGRFPRHARPFHLWPARTVDPGLAAICDENPFL
jgi:hypothetical protein